MASKQILFRLDTITATALEKKLTEKGISKQFLFTKVVKLFLDDKLSFDNNVIANSNDNNKITIDSSEVAETIKNHYLEDIAKLIANDRKMIALVTKKLESNVQAELAESDNKSYHNDNKKNDSDVITFDIEDPTIVEDSTELEMSLTEGTISPETKKEDVTDDRRGAKSKSSAIAILKTLPREMTGKELEKAIGMKSTYASKYKTEPEKARYDKHRHILQLLEMPRAKGDKWINPYGKQTKKPLNDDGVL